MGIFLKNAYTFSAGSLIFAKNGVDRKGPNINRNDWEGLEGRTTLMVFFNLWKGVNLSEEDRYQRDFA